jgi:DNA-binding NarL/FixJ family response regulator
MINILLADDHEMFREGLTVLLESHPDFKVVAQAADGHKALELAEQLRPTVMVVDMLMPGLNGLEVTRQVRKQLPETHVVVLSMHADESYVVTALRYGADGYVLKESSADDLVKAIRAATLGSRFLSSSLTERAIQSYITYGEATTSTGTTNRYNRLTSREREVLKLSLQGLSAAEIARLLVISIRTVETHRSHLMHKLGVHNQDELVEYARAHKLSPHEDDYSLQYT